MNNEPYLSICIPTYNRLDILANTIESIYSDLQGIDMVDFEVVISDNSPDLSAESIVGNYDYANLHYFETSVAGFLNSLNALKCGKGKFLKLHNNYTMLRTGTLRGMISDIKRYSKEKPVIFYTDGLSKIGSVRSFTSFDSFMYELSYFSSWSTGFGIWREDLLESIDIDRYFPQTSLLFAQSTKSKYILEGRPLFANQNVPKKGGYNIFKVFSVDFVNLLIKANESSSISKKTLSKIKKDLLYKYLSVRYFKTCVVKVDEFEHADLVKHITTHYSYSSYGIMVVLSFLSPLRHLFRKIRISLYR